MYLMQVCAREKENESESESARARERERERERERKKQERERALDCGFVCKGRGWGFGYVVDVCHNDCSVEIDR